MDNTKEENFLGDFMGSFQDMIGSNGATVLSKDSTGVDIKKLIDDTIYGLLSEESLSTEQVQLLSGLVQGRG